MEQIQENINIVIKINSLKLNKLNDYINEKNKVYINKLKTFIEMEQYELKKILEKISFIKNNIMNLKNELVYKSQIIYNPLFNINKFILKDAFYINLEESIERKNNIEKNNFNLKLNRFNAIKNEYGHIGCSQSHIALLEYIQNNYSNIENTYFMILEDDIVIYDKSKYDDYWVNLSNVIRYNLPDIIVLSGTNRVISYDKTVGFGFYKLLNSNTTCSYIVKGSFIGNLINKFKLGLNGLLECDNLLKLNKKTEIMDSLILGYLKSYYENVYCIDQIWNNNITNEKWVTYIDTDIIGPDLNIVSIINKDVENEKLTKYNASIEHLYKIIIRWSDRYIIDAKFHEMKNIVFKIMYNYINI